MDVLRSCYTGTWHLPGWGDVAGYFYFADEGTPFLPGWSFLGTRNWHAGDGSSWPTYGEKENTNQIWRGGSFAGEKPLPIAIGEEFCLEQEMGIEFTPIAWRGGLPVRCFRPVEDEMPTGAIIGFGGSVIPDGWLLCDGAAVNRVYYSELFAVCGTAWGPGDGVNTFNVPDLRGRALIGAGAGIGLTNRLLGSQGGEEQHLLTVPEMPFHTHAYQASTLLLAKAAGPPPLNVMSTPAPANVVPTGGDLPHNNMQPWASPTWIVKT